MTKFSIINLIIFIVVLTLSNNLVAEEIISPKPKPKIERLSKKEILNQLVSDGIIKCYYLIYDGGTEVRLFRKLRLIKNDLQELNFDIFLARESFLSTYFFISRSSCNNFT